MKLGTWEYNEVQKIAADVMLAAEMAVLRGNKKKAIDDAKAILGLPECAAYFPAARAVLQRCELIKGKAKAKRGEK